MIKIEAIVREEKLEDVKEALSEIEVHGINMLPKIKFEIVVSDENWEKKTIEAIQKAAYTGHPGDGKIISFDLKSALRIRTGETGKEAIN